MTGLSHEKHCFNRIVQRTVHTHHLIFVFKVGDSTQPTYNDLGTNVFRAINQQVFKLMYDYLFPRLALQLRAFRFDHLDTLFKRKQRSFVPVDRNTNYKTVNECRPTFDNIKMPQSNWVKSSRI